MNYPWYNEIPLQGVNTACSGLPEIQNQIDVLHKVLCSNPSINKTILCFQKYLVRRQKGAVAREATKFV